MEEIRQKQREEEEKKLRRKDEVRNQVAMYSPTGTARAHKTGGGEAKAARGQGRGTILFPAQPMPSNFLRCLTLL
jgi:hypothetical protein